MVIKIKASGRCVVGQFRVEMPNVAIGSSKLEFEFCYCIYQVWQLILHYYSYPEKSVPKTRAPRALRAHKLARAYVPTRLTRLRALSRAL